MHVALVHDWLNQIGGAEDVLESLVEMYPGAPIYTSMYAPELMPPARAAIERPAELAQVAAGLREYAASGD